MGRVTLDDTEDLILEHLFSEENVEDLLDHFEEESIRQLILKFGLDLPECLEDEPDIEEERDDDDEDDGQPVDPEL